MKLFLGCLAFLHLRYSIFFTLIFGGVRTAEFERRFGVTMEAVYGEVIERLLKEGLLEASAQTDSHIRLTEYGLDVSTYALAEFLQ